jgi:hypothetical protein
MTNINQNKKQIFQLQILQWQINMYMGSSGLGSFLSILPNFLKRPNKPLFFNSNLQSVNSEFNKLMNVLNNFHKVARQLNRRYSNRPTIKINDEYDVQDLLHSLLRLHFGDIRVEEWTPSYAGKCSRMDFIIKDLGVIIEVKKTRKGLEDKQLGDQLIIDKERYKNYPDCNLLIYFVYDPEYLITNPKGLIKDLSSSNSELSVEVIVNPS